MKNFPRAADDKDCQANVWRRNARSYFNANNWLKSARFTVVEQALCEVVRSGHAPAVTTAEMHNLVQTTFVAGTVV